MPATGADAWFGSVGGARESPPEPSKPPQVADLLEQVATSGGRLVDASDVLVYLVERDTHGGQRLIVRRGAGCFATSMGCSVGKGEGLAGEVWRIGAPLAVEEDQTWPLNPAVRPLWSATSPSQTNPECDTRPSPSLVTVRGRMSLVAFAIASPPELGC